MYTYIDTYTYIYIYIHTHMYIYIYIYNVDNVITSMITLIIIMLCILAVELLVVEPTALRVPVEDEEEVLPRPLSIASYI